MTAVHGEDSSGNELVHGVQLVLHTEATDVFAYSFQSHLFIGLSYSEYSNFQSPSLFLVCESDDGA